MFIIDKGYAGRKLAKFPTYIPNNIAEIYSKLPHDISNSKQSIRIYNWNYKISFPEQQPFDNQAVLKAIEFFKLNNSEYRDVEIDYATTKNDDVEHNKRRNLLNSIYKQVDCLKE